MQHPDVVEIKQQMTNMINRIPVNIDTTMIGNYVNKVHTAIKSGLGSAQLDKHYNDVVNKVQTVVNKHYDDLAKDQEYLRFKRLFGEIYQEVCNYLNAKNRTWHLLADFFIMMSQSNGPSNSCTIVTLQ